MKISFLRKDKPPLEFQERIIPPPAMSMLNDSDLRVPDSGEFFRIPWTWELARYNYKPYQYVDGFEQPNKSMPDPIKLWGCEARPTSGYQEIHPSWQFRYFELFRLIVGPIPEDGKVIYYYTGGEGSRPRTIVPKGTPHSMPAFEPGTLLDAYSHIWEDHRALTDGAAYNTENGWYRDEVMKCHMENPRTWRIKCLAWHGSIVQKHPNPPLTKPGYTTIRAWDHRQPAPPMDVLLAPDAPPLWWGVDASPEPLKDANNNYVMRNGRKTYKVAHYPWLKLVCRKYGIKPEVGTPFFPVGVGGYNLIPNADIQGIENGIQYSPYWPPK
jgi:hypothetical protein